MSRASPLAAVALAVPAIAPACLSRDGAQAPPPRVRGSDLSATVPRRPAAWRSRADTRSNLDLLLGGAVTCPLSEQRVDDTHVVAHALKVARRDEPIARVGGGVLGEVEAVERSLRQ